MDFSQGPRCAAHPATREKTPSTRHIRVSSGERRRRPRGTTRTAPGRISGPGRLGPHPNRRGYGRDRRLRPGTRARTGPW